MDTSKILRTRAGSSVFKYGVAILSVGTAHLITQSLQPTVFPTPLFFGAIVITTWLGGLGPGLVAVLLATLLLDFYFLSPVHTFTHHSADLFYLAQFLFPALLSSWFTRKRKEAEAALKQARDQLDGMVRERTAQLQNTNEQLQSEIIERKRAEEAVYKTQADLAHLTRVMTMNEMATSIAHEVNQPLAAIINNGSAGMRWLAADPPNIERARDSLAHIINQGNRASEVIKRIRAFSKKAPLQRSALDINEVISEVLVLVETELVKHRVILTSELNPDLPRVFGDRVQLQQVILNLIVNGIEAMAGDLQRRRTLLIGSDNGEAGNVLVVIRDCGNGLNEQDLERIFDAFFTTKPGGVGVGLSISRTIVEAHGGHLWASANSGPGATFQFTLPARQDHEFE